MATSEQHIRQWEHNRSLIPVIPKSHPDWIVTVGFYVALQAVDALLAKSGSTPQSHQNRNDILTRTNNYEKIWRHYHPLYQLSRAVRYLAKPSEWIPVDQIEKEVFSRNLYQIEGAVRRLMNKETEVFPAHQTIGLSAA